MNFTEEQLKAINSEGTNIIVSAGAGSGKTAVLTERVLRKLKNGVNIDDLLILTFTNAAAEEMKERIRKKIQNENFNNQLDRLDNSYITTFDSYALSIVKKYGYLENISKSVSIIETSIIDLKKIDILDEIFEDMYKENDSKFKKLINDFCIKDDKSLKQEILSINKKLELIYDLDNYLDEYLDKFYNDSYINSKIDEYNNLLLKKIDKINDLINDISNLVDSKFFNELNEALSKLLTSNTLEEIKSNLCKTPRLPHELNDAASIKKQIDDIIRELEVLCDFDNIESIRNSIYETKDYVEVLIRIIKQFNKRVFDYKQKNDLFEFIDIEHLAIKILKNNSDIAKRIKNSLNEIMIDEYQDTNDLQDLFISLISNNNVYMVGDIKQSIYRFRNANPLIFKSKYDMYESGQNGIKIDLNKNFRSRSEVIEDINLIFNNIMSNSLGGADYKKSHQLIFGNNMYLSNSLDNNHLEIYNYDYDDTKYSKDEIEIFTIIDDIRKKINSHYKVFDKDTKIFRDLKYSDIVILMDRASKFDLYKKIFEYNGIPLTIYKDEVLTNSIIISIFKNIINLKLSKEYNEEFKYSFISIMRSFLYNIDDNDIFKYFIDNSFIESDLMKKINNIDISDLNIKELVLKIIDEFEIYENLIKIGDIDNHIVTIDYLINLCDSLAQMGYTIEKFYEFLNKLIENNYEIKYQINKNTNGVKIMTIHKSKGLEYQLCYYSGLSSKFNISDLNDKFIFSKNYGFVTPYISNGIRTTIYKSLLKNEYVNDEISEKIRLFYVALTRAREKMIIISKSFTDVKNNYNSFYDILNSISEKLEKYSKNINLDSINLTKDYNLIKKVNYKDKIKLTNQKLNIESLNISSSLINSIHYSKETNELYTKNIKNNIELGLKFHSILENIDFKNPNFEGVDKFLQQKVSSFLKSKILDGAINIYREYEFVNNDSIGKIDLLLEFEDCFKVVDYKLNNVENSEYINQVNGYKDYIFKLTDKPVDAYLYSILAEELYLVEDGNLIKI